MMAINSLHKKAIKTFNMRTFNNNNINGGNIWGGFFGWGWYMRRRLEQIG